MRNRVSGRRPSVGPLAQFGRLGRVRSVLGDGAKVVTGDHYQVCYVVKSTSRLSMRASRTRRAPGTPKRS